MNSTAVKDQLHQLEAAEQSADAGPACTTAAHGETEFFDLTDEQFQEQYLSGMLNSNFRSIGRSECPQIETELVERQPQQDSISPLMKQQVGQLDEWLGGEVIEKLPDSPTAKRLRARRAKQTSKMRSPPAAASGRRSSAIPLSASVVAAAAAHAAAMRELNGCLPSTRALVTALLRPGSKPVQCAAALLPQTNYREYADLLLGLAEGFSQGPALVAECLKCDIGGVTNPSTILRSETLQVRLAAQFVALVGTDWLRSVLIPVLDTILDLDLELSVHMLDPKLSATEQESTVAANAVNMQKSLILLLEAIESSLERLPWQISYVMHVAYAAVQESFPDHTEMPVPVCGSLLFLRFICPAITCPADVGIEIATDRAARRKLVMLTKYLLIIANGQLHTCYHCIHPCQQSFTTHHC